MQTEALAICPKSGQLCHPVPKRVTPWCTLLVQGLLKNSTRASLRSCSGGTAASRLDCNGQPSVEPFQTAPTAIPRGIPHSRDGDNAGLAQENTQLLTLSMKEVIRGGKRLKSRKCLRSGRTINQILRAQSPRQQNPAFRLKMWAK